MLGRQGESRYHISSHGPDAAQVLDLSRAHWRNAINLLKTEKAKPKEPIRGKRIHAALDLIGLRQK